MARAEYFLRLPDGSLVAPPSSAEQYAAVVAYRDGLGSVQYTVVEWSAKIADVNATVREIELIKNDPLRSVMAVAAAGLETGQTVVEAFVAFVRREAKLLIRDGLERGRK